MVVNTVRFKFFKKDELKYLSHLDVLALMERALMRTGMPLLYSGGFHPKPKLSFSNPIPLGVQSLAEYCDIELLEKISPEDFTRLLNLKLPDNLKVIKALSFEKIPENKILSLMSAIDIVLYEYELLFGEIPLDSFLKDFGKLFGPEGENKGSDADLQKIKSSIHYYEAATAAQNAIGSEPTDAALKNANTAAAIAAAAPTNANTTTEIAAAAPTNANNAAKTSLAAIQSTAAAATPAAISTQAAQLPMENIFFLKIQGYAKILKNSSNTIFKFNAFNEYFEKFLENKDIEIRQVQKTGAYILEGKVLKDPMEIIPF
jgi:radical SAM-linked protein